MAFSKRNKWGNKKVIYDGITFDSTKEKDRYITLCWRQQQGIISDLKTQVEYIVIPHLYTMQTKVLKTKTKQIQRTFATATKYIADFVYTDQNGNMVVEDVKGSKHTITPEFRLKQKLMKHIYNIEIKIVFNPNE